jgi:hypothetical protein
MTDDPITAYGERGSPSTSTSEPACSRSRGRRTPSTATRSTGWRGARRSAAHRRHADGPRGRAHRRDQHAGPAPRQRLLPLDHDDASGATALTGFDVVQLADDGRIARLTGFFDTDTGMA